MNRNANPAASMTFPAAMGQAQRPTGPLLGIVIATVIFFVAQLAALPAGMPSEGAGLTFVQQAVLTGSFGVGAVLLLLWVRFKERRPIRSLGFAAPGAGAKILRGALIGLVMISAVALITVASGQGTLGAPNWSALLPALVLLVGFTIQGSTEELFARGYLVQAVSWKWGLLAAFVVQTVWFTLLHGANGGITVVPVLNLVLVAVFLGFWSLAEEGLWGVCAFHAVWNWGQGNLWGAHVSNMDVETSVLSFRPTPGAGDLISGGSFGFEGSLVSSLMLALGTVVAVVMVRRRRRAATADQG